MFGKNTLERTASTAISSTFDSKVQQVGLLYACTTSLVSEKLWKTALPNYLTKSFKKSVDASSLVAMDQRSRRRFQAVQPPFFGVGVCIFATHLRSFAYGPCITLWALMDGQQCPRQSLASSSRFHVCYLLWSPLHTS